MKKEDKRINLADRINSRRHDLHPLHIGDKVYVQPLIPHQREWIPATISQQLTIRRYEVKKSDGKLLVRNRRFLRPIRLTI